MTGSVVDVRSASAVATDTTDPDRPSIPRIVGAFRPLPMTGIERRPEAETEYRDHQERSGAIWNRWSGWYRASERDFEPLDTYVLGAVYTAKAIRVED